MKSPRLVAVGISLLLVGSVLAWAGISMLLERNEFKSVATVQVDEPFPPAYSGPYFLLTEFETIQSHMVLGKVVASMKLKKLWPGKYNHEHALSDSEIEAIIKKHIELQNVRDNRLINIAAFDDNPNEAAQLANAIAQSYREYRNEEARILALERRRSNVPFRQVVVMNLAVPEMRPIRPNRYLAGALLGCGIFLMIGGLVFFNGREAVVRET